MCRRALVVVAVGLVIAAACSGQPAPQPAAPPPAPPASAPPASAPPSAPAPVGGLTLSADPSINRATISWQPPSGGSGPEWYALGVHENGAQRGAFVCYAPCIERTINLTPGASAWVSVRALNAVGGSTVAKSNTVLVSKPCPLACVTVDATQSAGPALGRARGFLHSIGPKTDPGRVDALQPEHWRVSGTWNGGAGPAFAAQHGAKVTYVLSGDWHDATTTGQGAAEPWADWDRYTTFITDTMNLVRAQGIAVEYWDIQNEPGGRGYYPPTIAPSADQLLLQFKVAYQAIKAADPNAKVIAPSLIAYADQPGEENAKLDLRTFLDYASGNGLAFDAISFHDNRYLNRPDVYAPDWWGMAPDEVIRSVERLRLLLAERPSLGSPAILVNEYSDPTTTGLPGWSVGRIAALEAADVDQANRTCWGTCEDGWLDGLLTGDGETTYPNYWVYAYYAQMSGNRAPVTTSNTSVTAFATTGADGTVRVLLGRHQGCNPGIQGERCPNQPVLADGDVTLQVRVPSRAVALVTAQAIPAAAAPLAAPVAKVTLPVSVTVDGVVTVPLRGVGDGDAWQITIDPG
jgi:hypothetical protein